MNAVKKSMLFSGNSFYPSGGWEDYQGCFVTIEEALQHLEKMWPDLAFQWAHVVVDYKIVVNSYANDEGDHPKWDHHFTQEALELTQSPVIAKKS